jgi:quinoprotein glucose dehydrogenase
VSAARAKEIVTRCSRWTITASVAAGLLAVVTVAASAQSGAAGGEWRTWGGDLGNTRYAPLDQIDAGNFGTLEVAWRFKTEDCRSI